MFSPFIKNHQSFIATLCYQLRTFCFQSLWVPACQEKWN